MKDPSRVDPATGEMEATLFKSMEHEHIDPALKDTNVLFASNNGVETTSRTEWEIVVEPKKRSFDEGLYPERKGLREAAPEHCRK